LDADWRQDLDRWLAPFMEALGHKARRRMCPAYIAGLIGPGDRKSIQPMAAKAEDIGYDRLHHFIAAGVWDSAPLEAALWRQADALVGGTDGWLIVDEPSSSLVASGPRGGKKGSPTLRRSRVARQGHCNEDIAGTAVMRSATRNIQSAKVAQGICGMRNSRRALVCCVLRC